MSVGGADRRRAQNALILNLFQHCVQFGDKLPVPGGTRLLEYT